MKKKTLIEIWGDVVAVKSLVISILVITVTTMGAHLLAPRDDRTLGLFFGLGGAILGFVIMTLTLKPKRHVIDEEAAHRD